MNNYRSFAKLILLLTFSGIIILILERIAGRDNFPKVYSFFYWKVLILISIIFIIVNMLRERRTEKRLCYTLRKLRDNLFPCAIAVIWVIYIISIVNQKISNSTTIRSLGAISEISYDQDSTNVILYSYNTKSIFEIKIIGKDCLRKEIKKFDSINFNAKRGLLGFIFVPREHECSDLSFSKRKHPSNK